MVNPRSTLSIVLRSLEILLFGFALFVAIPTVPSEEGHVYRFLPVVIFGGGAFGLSMLLAGRRGAENWVTALLKLGFYLLLTYVLLQRVQIR